MPNTRIRDKWEPIVKQIIADLGPRTGPNPILRELKRRAGALRKGGEQIPTDYPSTRTIQRIKGDTQPEELREYQRFSWPESMNQGGLPWEAGRAALELLAYLHREGTGRPPTQVVRWFWRATQAAPDAPIEDRLLATRCLIMAEWLPPISDTAEYACRSAEWLLAYAPWRSEDNLQAYRQASQNTEGEAERIPIPGIQIMNPTAENIPAPVAEFMELISFTGINVSPPVPSSLVRQQETKEVSDGEAQG